MDFIWKMTEKNWENMENDRSASSYEKLSEDYDFYGQMYVGDYCVEFIVSNGDNGTMFAFTNVYQLFVDDDYSYTEDSVPYSLINGCICVPKAKNFNEFKTLCEKDFIYNIGTEFNENVANKKCEWTM